MAASVSGAIKALLEAQGLGVSVFRDQKPSDQNLSTWITVQEDISTAPDGLFNAFDDPEGHVSELVQVDIWQQARNPTTRVVTESYTVTDAVMKALHGTKLSAAPKAVSGVTVVDRTRLLEPENNIIHTALTVQVRRTLA